jgi:4-amino-4-deoxy-L-arabinose transferase-like glycosyltransferase
MSVIGRHRQASPQKTPSLWAARVLLLGCGVWMSGWRLHVPELTGDEQMYIGAGRAYISGDYTPNTEHPPLGKLLMGAAQAAFGDSLLSARLPSAVAMFGVGVLLWVWLGRAAAHPAAGPVAALVWWTVPVLSDWPETLEHPPVTPVLARAALLDPLAGGIAMAAVCAGWWWLRSRRCRAAVVCGVLAGLAAATKLPALFVVAVPAVAGCVASASGDGTWPLRLGRLLGQTSCWVAGAAAGFAAAFAPLGSAAGVVLREMIRFQRQHAADGHSVLVAGTPARQAPWWLLGYWQYVSWGAVLTSAAALAMAVGLVSRSSLTGYLTAAWLLPTVGIPALTGLALPHYLLLFRPELAAATAAGAAVVMRWAAGRRLALRATAAAAASVVALPVVVSSAASVTMLQPTGYAALPALVRPDTKVWLLASPAAGYYLLPGRILVYRPDPRLVDRVRPDVIVIDRGVALRGGDGGLPGWVRLHGYHLTRSGGLDVWTAAKRTTG